jgi:hypothetical protein
MSTIDYTKLNESATELIGLARRQARVEIEEKTRVKSALDHGIDKLDIIIGLCENVGPTLKPGSDTERILSAWVRRACGTVPIFGAGITIDSLRNALGTEGILPNWSEATRHAKAAKVILSRARSNDS